MHLKDRVIVLEPDEERQLVEGMQLLITEQQKTVAKQSEYVVAFLILSGVVSISALIQFIDITVHETGLLPMLPHTIFLLSSLCAAGYHWIRIDKEKEKLQSMQSSPFAQRDLPDEDVDYADEEK